MDTMYENLFLYFNSQVKITEKEIPFIYTLLKNSDNVKLNFENLILYNDNNPNIYVEGSDLHLQLLQLMFTDYIFVPSNGRVDFSVDINKLSFDSILYSENVSQSYADAVSYNHTIYESVNNCMTFLSLYISNIDNTPEQAQRNESDRLIAYKLGEDQYKCDLFESLIKDKL